MIMTTHRNRFALLLASLLVVSACGNLDQDSIEQSLPAGIERPDVGMTDFALNRPTINRLWGSGDKDVWGVGNNAMAMHWDGKVWRRIAVPTGSDLLAVWGVSDKDAWAVGEEGVVIHWDGTRWSRST